MCVGTAEDEEEPPSDLFETLVLALGKGGVGAAGSDLDCPPGLEREGDVEDDDDAQEGDSERREEELELVRAFFAFFPLLLLLLLLVDAAAGTPDGREPESAGDPRSGGGMATAFWLPARPPFFLLFFLALGGAAPDADADAEGTSAAAPDNESAAIPSAIALASS